MDIKQHKQFLLSEIKINNPLRSKWEKYIIEELNNWEYEESVTWDLPVSKNEEKELQNNIDKNNGDLRITIDGWPLAIYNGGTGFEFEVMDDKNLDEDVSNFKVGQTKQSDGHKSTVTDVNTTTQSVTWDIKKDITDKEIWDDLTKIIRKFETIQVKDFHSRPKLIQLIKDLKTIRNKFSRTIQK